MGGGERTEELGSCLAILRKSFVSSFDEKVNRSAKTLANQPFDDVENGKKERRTGIREKKVIGREAPSTLFFKLPIPPIPCCVKLIANGRSCERTRKDTICLKEGVESNFWICTSPPPARKEQQQFA